MLVGAAAGLAIGAMPGCVVVIGASGWEEGRGSDARRFTEARAFTLPASGVKVVDIETEFGDVDVAPLGVPLPEWAAGEWPEPGPGEALVVAVLGSKDRGRLEKGRVEPRRVGGTLELRDQWPSGGRKGLSEGAAYAIRLPVVEGAEVSTEFGRIRVEGAEGGAVLESGFGGITVIDHRGPLDVSTEYGDLRVEAAGGQEGRFALETGYGDVEVEGSEVPVRVWTDYGDIEVVGASGPVVAETDYGRVEAVLTEGNGGPVDLSTGFGSVRLRVGEGFSGAIEARTEHGRVTSSGLEGLGVVESEEAGDGSRVRLSFPESGRVSRLRSGHGSVGVEGW